MAEEDITEKQVISFLLNKRQMLIDELNKVELALEALNVGNDFVPYMPENLIHLNKGSSQPSTEKPPLKKVTEFDSNSKLDGKIAFALTLDGELTKEQILEVLVKHMPGLNQNKFEKTLAVRLSYLLKANMIGATKSGRNYSYRLLTNGD